MKSRFQAGAAQGSSVHGYTSTSPMLAPRMAILIEPLFPASMRDAP